MINWTISSVVGAGVGAGATARAMTPEEGSEISEISGGCDVDVEGPFVPFPPLPLLLPSPSPLLMLILMLLLLLPLCGAPRLEALWP
jgi:hypothetical protein